MKTLKIIFFTSSLWSPFSFIRAAAISPQHLLSDAEMDRVAVELRDDEIRSSFARIRSLASECRDLERVLGEAQDLCEAPKVMAALKACKEM